MPKISQEEYARRALKFIEHHKESYTDGEIDFIKRNVLHEINNTNTASILRQLYDEVGITDINQNMYEGFFQILNENFDINNDIIEIGGGIIPSLAKKVALRQQTGKITVYDPRLITKSEYPDNLILKKEMFTKETNLENTKLIIGFMPCDATHLLIETACCNNIDFMIGLCEGGRREGYGWIEYDDEWVDYVKYCAEQEIKKSNMGTLEEKSLLKYGSPYPIIYNKRRKS